MSDNSESNAVLGFAVGAIVVAALAFIFFVIPGSHERGNAPRDVNVTIEAPKVPAPAPSNPG